MKMSEIYAKPGRAVAYYPKLALALNSIPAAIFLCQFVYWWEKGNAAEGWIYKTAEEIESETGLSYEQQKGARRKLKTQSLIKEHYARKTNRMYYRVDLERLEEVWRLIENHSNREGIPLKKAMADLIRCHNEERRAEQMKAKKPKRQRVKPSVPVSESHAHQ